MSDTAYLDILNARNSKFKLESKRGASSEDIAKEETRLKVKLPNDLCSFYLRNNGLEGDWLFNITPLNEVEKLRDNYGEYLTFAEYMIYSETCGLAIDPTSENKYRIFVHKPDSNKKTWKRKYICDSISEFIKLYCAHGTLGVFAD